MFEKNNQVAHIYLQCYFLSYKCCLQIFVKILTSSKMLVRQMISKGPMCLLVFLIQLENCGRFSLKIVHDLCSVCNISAFSSKIEGQMWAP